MAYFDTSSLILDAAPRLYFAILMDASEGRDVDVNGREECEMQDILLYVNQSSKKVSILT
jgi:hypothetical protein